MFTGETKTYLDIKDFVEANYGPLDEAGEYQFLVYLGNMIDSMWADLRKSTWYLSQWTITPVDGIYSLPSDLARVCSVTGTTAGVSPAPDVTKIYDLHLAGCSAGNGGCARDSVSWSSAGTVSASVGATAIVPTDTPTTMTVIGYRRPVHAFFTYDNTTHCRTWADIDLPEVFRNVFGKAVVGMMFFGGGDSPRAADWLNFANDEFVTLRRTNPEVVDGTPAQRGAYIMASKRLFHDCGCHLGDGWQSTLVSA